ncbi:MAG TPA: hypothetical protein VN081_02210, partial [Dongiaceae bacterium]|nr:hypothetical protein [Dongiaceae bacterium]
SGTPAKAIAGDINIIPSDIGAASQTDLNTLEGVVDTSVSGYVTEYSVNSSETVPPSTGWSTSTPTRTPGTFIWYRVTVTYNDTSTSTTSPALLTGNTGATGSQGIPGTPGADGTSLYTWLKYADTPTTGMSDSPTGKTYIGIAVNKSSSTESSLYSDYSWSLIQGPQGNQGIPGTPGADGTTTYTWVKYGDDATGTGLTDSPTGKAYIGLAFNKTTATESTLASDYTWSLIQGPQGTQGVPGTPAAVIALTATTQVLSSPAGGGTTTPATSVVTGTATNTTITVWQYSSDGGAFTSTAPTGVSRSGNVVTITGATITAKTITVKMADANGVADTLTVAKVSDGATGATGGTGGTGPAGADAYTVLLTNEAQVFPGTTTAAIAGSATTNVMAFKGATQIAATIGTITGQVTGLTTAITNNGTTTAGITITVTTSLTTKSGNLTIPLTVDGKSFTQIFSWSLSLTGATGSTGSTGAPGSNGISVTSITPYFAQVTTGSGAPAKPTTATPVAPWVSTEPDYVTNTELYRTEKILFSDATFAYTNVSKVSSYTAAVTAITAANGKNTIKFSTSDPGSTANTAGDIWFTTSGATITKQWQGNGGTSWTQVTLTNTVIANLDAGKITTGSLDAARIAANSLSIGQVSTLQTTLDTKATTAYVQGKGTDLIVNGFGTMGSNYNFSWSTFTAADAPTGAAGSFVSPNGVAGGYLTDEYLPVDPNRKLKFSFQIRETGTSVTSHFYGLIQPFDAYKNSISPQHYMYVPNTTTTLAAPLNPGDTTITLTSAANWYGSAGKPAGAAPHLRHIIFWDYVDPGGKAWPIETYSRNQSIFDLWADGGITGNVITLSAPYSGPAKATGTPVSNGSSGGTYIYISGGANAIPTTSWVQWSDSIIGLVTQTGSVSGMSASFLVGWPPGIGYCKAGWLLN